LCFAGENFPPSERRKRNMEMVRKTLKQSSVMLAIFLLFGGGLSLPVGLLGYPFVPMRGPVATALSAAVIVFLAVFSVGHNKKKTKLSAVCAALIPLLTFFFVIAKGLTQNTSGIGPELALYIVHSYVTMLCGMYVFEACARGKFIRIGLGIPYCILLVLLISSLFMSMFALDISF